MNSSNLLYLMTEQQFNIAFIIMWLYIVKYAQLPYIHHDWRCVYNLFICRHAACTRILYLLHQHKSDPVCIIESYLYPLFQYVLIGKYGAKEQRTQIKAHWPTINTFETLLSKQNKKVTTNLSKYIYHAMNLRNLLDTWKPRYCYYFYFFLSKILMFISYVCHINFVLC